MSFDRRLVLKGMGAAALAGTSMLGLGARRARAEDLTVGFIYVGARDDYGYNQAHAEAAAALKEVPGLNIIEEENVPETVDVEKTMESMIELDGAKLLFPTSFGYFEPHMLKMAAKYPDAEFRHCGGLWTESKHPKNTGSYFGYIGTCQYLNGIVAGHMSKSKKIGFVAAKPIPQVLININSFALGAKSVDPSITTQVIFTGEWSLAVKEAEATNSLVDQGIDVVTCHVDGPKVTIETAERRGIYTCGYHADQSALAPKGYLTGAEWNWIEAYKTFIDAAVNGTPMPNFLRGGLKEGFVKTSAYGPAVSEAAKTQADAVKAEMKAGKFSIFKGPLKDNKGNQVVAAGAAYAEDAIELESIDWLVEGVVGSTS